MSSSDVDDLLKTILWYIKHGNTMLATVTMANNKKLWWEIGMEREIIEKSIAQDPEWSAAYADSVIRGRWPDGEKAIATSPKWSYWYATYVVKGRWKPGERAIAESPRCSMLYAMDVIEGRWEPGEEAIKRHPLDWQSYLEFLERCKRWPE